VGLADSVLFSIGLLLVILGFAVSILAILMAVFSSSKTGGRVRGGGVVMIGPIPIIFGTDKRLARVLVLLTIVLMAIFLVFTIFLWGV
jgi:uncharacterized protein (TIGR00304 family)